MEQVDLAIIGGGISGVAVAQCAAAAGYSVVLLEKSTLAAGTSSQSSKLIHGGLRYLESGQLDLVRESLRARRELLRLAPTLVKAVPFFIPVYRDSRRGALTLRAGLSLYGLLSEFDRLGRFRSLPARAWGSFPGLKLAGMTHMFQYWDAQTDDALLTKAVADSARLLGADIREGAECLTIEHDPQGCKLSYRDADGDKMLHCRFLVNAAGAFVNELLARVTPPIAQTAIDWVQGSHLLLDIPAPPGVLYLESCFDERVVFVMPWYGKTLIGTTETLCQGPVPQITREEIAYLLGIYRHYFGGSGSFTGAVTIEALEAKVLAHFSGMRVLPKGDGDAFGRPREVQLYQRYSHPRLLTLYGGKLTTFRATAKAVTAEMSKVLGKRSPKADVDKLMLG
ncbi:FAD-dependent oxidoreductase [Shewanella algae]|uniref:FAD-dependent oxidoreductase n=1 Tax=Shewanella algae TaxID=38313 RepID=UPI0031F5D82A